MLWAANSVLMGEMELLEPEAEDAAPRDLYYAPLSFLPQIGSNSQTWRPSPFWSTIPARSAPARNIISASCPIMPCAVHLWPKMAQSWAACRPTNGAERDLTFYLSVAHERWG